MLDDLSHHEESDVIPFTPLHPVFAAAPDSVTFRKLRKRLVRQTLEAVRAYGMVSADKSGAGRKPDPDDSTSATALRAASSTSRRVASCFQVSSLIVRLGSVSMPVCLRWG